jgi:hypothetical protein
MCGREMLAEAKGSDQMKQGTPGSKENKRLGVQFLALCALHMQGGYSDMPEDPSNAPVTGA